MSTIQATKLVQINSISEFVAAGRNFGFENVTSNWFSEIISDSVRNDFSADLYIEVLDKCTNVSLGSILSAMFRNDTFIDKLSNKLNIEKSKVIEDLTNIVIYKKLYIEIPSIYVNINQLNTLAEMNLLSLYCIEDVESIDLDFVKKYFDELDIHALLRKSKNESLCNEIKKMLE